MSAVTLALQISIAIYLLIGVAMVILGSPFVVFPILIIVGLVGLLVHHINRQSKTAAKVGVAVMILYTLSIFFPLGVAGLVGAYRSRNDWLDW